MRLLTLLVITLGTVLAPASVRAQALPEADAAYEAAELDRALLLYERARSEGGLSSDALTRAYRRLGILYASTGDDDAAADRFEMALALDPEMAAPAELGPAQIRLFETIRTSRDGATLRLEATPSGPVERGAARIEVRIEGAPEGAVSRLRMSSLEDDGALRWRAELEPGPTLDVADEAWGEGPSAQLRVEALDAASNTMAQTSVTLTRLAVQAAPVDPLAGEVEGPSESDDGVLIGVIVGVVVALAAAAGITAAILLTSEDEYFLVPRLE